MATGGESNYNQPEKKECRKRLIEHAIKCLTTERNTSACVSRDHVQKVWQQLHETNEVPHYFSKDEISNIEKEMKNWELFHDCQIQTKKPSDLRVCYLAGNDPTNDLKVLVDNGVLCQNVWAIEKDSQTLEKAWESINKSQPQMRNVRLFKGNFLDFLKDFEGEFDIIYFDACGTLPSKQDTLKAIGYIFLYNKLTSPGALITTFSFPPKQSEQANADQDKQRNGLRDLFQKYLKYRLVNTSRDDNDPEANEDFLSGRTDEENYGDYISYQIIDTAYMYIPALRMLSSKRNSLWEQIFVKKGEFLKDLEDHQRSCQSESDGPKTVEEILLTDRSVALMRDALTGFLSQLGNDLELNSSTNPYCQTWVKEVLPDWKSSDELKKRKISTLLLAHLLTNSIGFISKYSNEKFQSFCQGPLLKSIDEEEFPRFCDVPTPNHTMRMVATLLYGQMAHPSFPVLDKLLRLRYTARQRQMFSDVFIFDRCRYVYQQFPSLSCASFDFFREGHQQMVFRMAVDGLRKHLQFICPDVFTNCNVVNRKTTLHRLPKRTEVCIKEKEKELRSRSTKKLLNAMTNAKN